MHPSMKISMNIRSQASIAFLFTVLITFGHSVQAQAFTEFIPDPPVTDEPIIFREDFGIGCPPMSPNADGQMSWLLVEGNDVHLFYVFNLMAPCGVPPDGPVVDFNLGILPAGNYTLFRYRVPTSVAFPVDPDDFDPAPGIDFTVVAGTGPTTSPSPIPSLNALGLGSLVILLAGIAVWRFLSVRSMG